MSAAPFTVVGDAGALCEGDACALPSPTSSRPDRQPAGSAQHPADPAAEDRTDAAVTPPA